MPRRDEELKSNTVYWVHDMETGKGYRVWSKKVLDALIERGEIDPDPKKHRVQFCVSNGA